MSRRAWPVVLMLSLAAGCGGGYGELRGSLWEPPAAAPALPQTDHLGRPFDLAAHAGDVVLVFFGFAYCPDVCPVTLSTWARLADELGDEAARVEFVFVTVDPERDTPDRLAEHLAIFGERFIGLTGDTETMQRVWDDWHVYRKRREIGTAPGAYLVDHTSRIFVIDPAGMIRMSHEFNAPVEDLAHDVRALLRGA